MKISGEKRIIVRGLKISGTLLVVGKEIKGMSGCRIRVIVSSMDTAEGLMEFFAGRGAKTELDTAGDDYHVIVDLE